MTVSIPKAVADRIDYYVDNLGFWPSRSSFVREAVLEKCSDASQRYRELDAAKHDVDSSVEELPKREFDVADKVKELV